MGVITPWLLQAAFYFMSTYIMLALLPKLPVSFSLPEQCLDSFTKPKLHRSACLSFVSCFYLLIHSANPYQICPVCKGRGAGDKQPVNKLS